MNNSKHHISATKILELCQEDPSIKQLKTLIKSETEGMYTIVPTSLIYALPNRLQKAFEVIETSKTELADLIENHQNVFKEWL
jgi:uncharacterized protein YdeI (YjbR/CyaY-like superfamily)